MGHEEGATRDGSSVVQVKRPTGEEAAEFVGRVASEVVRASCFRERPGSNAEAHGLADGEASLIAACGRI